METRSKILIAVFILSIIGINLLFKNNPNSNLAIHAELANNEFTTQQKMNEYTPFVRSKSVKAEIEKEKQAIISKINKLKKKVNSDPTALTPTRAHEFHNPDSATLKTKDNSKKETKKDKKEDKEPQTEEEIAKAQKEAKEKAQLQEMIKEHCGDIKAKKDKDICKQAVTNYAEAVKKDKAREQAQKDKEKNEEENIDPNESADEEDFEDEEQEEDIVPVVSQPPAPAPKPDTSTTDTNEQRKTISLSEWRSFLESDIKINDFYSRHCGSSSESEIIETTQVSIEEVIESVDSNIENLKGKALDLSFATNMSGCEQLTEVNFLLLVKEYYLNSNTAELEKAGMESLNKKASLLRFEAAVDFLGNDQLAISQEEREKINSDFRVYYTNSERLGNLSLYLNSLAAPVKQVNETQHAEEFATAQNPWTAKNPLFVTMNLIKEQMSVLAAQTINLDNNNRSEVNRILALQSSLVSIQNELKIISEDTSIVDKVIEDASALNTLVSSLIEQIKTIEPAATPEVVTPPGPTQPILNPDGFTRRQKVEQK